MGLPRFAMVFLVLGCRVAATPAIAEPEAEAAPSEPPRVVERRETTPAQPPVLPTPTPVVAIALPYGPHAVFLAPVVDSGTVLFADELEPVRRRVIARLAELGHEVVPYEEIVRIETAAASGRLALEGDRQCRAPLTRRELVERALTGVIVAHAEALCVEDDCTLQVTVPKPGPSDESFFLTSRPLRRPYEPRSWVAAVASLEDRGASFGGIGLGGFGSSHPPPIMFGTPDPFGPWAKPPDNAVFDKIASDVHTCAHPDPRVGFTWTLRVGVAKDGRVTRCAASAEHTQARAGDGECLCGFVETLRYPAGRAGRRYRLDAIDDGGFRSDDMSFHEVQAGTEAWATRLNDAPALHVCDTRGVAPRTSTTTVVLDLAIEGTIRGVQVHGDFVTTEAIAWADCLVSELPKVPLPCAPPGVEQLHLRYGPLR